MKDVIFLAVAGALGTVGRFGLSSLTQRISGTGFPIGTLMVNVVGSLIIGFIMQLGMNSNIMSRQMRLVLTLGFLGAFTTFSSFSYETVRYLEQGTWNLATLNIALNVVLCLGATLAGMWLGRLTVANS